MKKLLIAFALLLIPGLASAQTQVGGKYVAAPITLTDGQQQTFRLDALGGLVTGGSASAGGSSAGQSGSLMFCQVVTGEQAYTVGTTQPCGMTPNGRVKISLSSATGIAPATQLATATAADLVACIYYNQVAWTAGYTGAMRCDAQGNQAVTLRGSQQLASGQVSVGTTATLIAAARADRARVSVTVTSATACYLGGSTVTTTTGYPLQAVAGVSYTMETNAAVYAVCAATATLGYMEQF